VSEQRRAVAEPASDRKPVRLTFPAYGTGCADILADGKCAGFCLDEGGGAYGYARRWRAYLFPSAQDRRMPRPQECEEVTGRTLGELRRALRERVERDGPWWTG
jgi:hypothetical protein